MTPIAATPRRPWTGRYSSRLIYAPSDVRSPSGDGLHRSAMGRCQFEPLHVGRQTLRSEDIAEIHSHKNKATWGPIGENRYRVKVHHDRIGQLHSIGTDLGVE